MSNKSLTETSKFLSYVLRHEPQAIGLQLDPQGWANIGQLIASAAQHDRLLDRELIQAVVQDNDKKRFAISEDGQRIRAVQGHSTAEVAIEHVQKEPPERLYHGTATRFLDSIMQQGLIAGSRHHVHLSQEQQTAVAVGQRYGQPVVLQIEALRMHQAGYRFFQAQNGVWLTETVPVDFIVQ